MCVFYVAFFSVITLSGLIWPCVPLLPADFCLISGATGEKSGLEVHISRALVSTNNTQLAAALCISEQCFKGIF